MLLTILLSAFQAAVAAGTAAPAVTSPSPAVAAASGKCPASMHWADFKRRPAIRRLDQLPPGRLELTVLRAMGNCPEPVVLREGIGGNPDSPDTPDRIQPGHR